MSETKIFCSVIIFTLGVYTLLLLQYELTKLSHLNISEEHDLNSCNSAPKTEFDLEKISCGSAGDLLFVKLPNCSELPCDILPRRNYSVELAFMPSRNITTLEIQTSIRQRRNLKYLHKEVIQGSSRQWENTTVEFSFSFPPHPVFKPIIKKPGNKCEQCTTYLLGVEIWDVDSGIGEVCLIIPMNVFYNTEEELVGKPKKTKSLC